MLQLFCVSLVSVPSRISGGLPTIARKRTSGAAERRLILRHRVRQLGQKGSGNGIRWLGYPDS
jgi:hypothetical protein